MSSKAVSRSVHPGYGGGEGAQRIVDHLLGQFDAVRIVNLIDRADRRREMGAQIERVGGFDGGRIAFYPAHRPADPGEFPSLGARGCFESHLGVLRQALAEQTERLLLLEDDLDFSADIMTRGRAVLAALAAREWDFFHGAHLINSRGYPQVAAKPDGLSPIAPDMPVMTASFLAVSRRALGPLVAFLEALERRPAGSADYGPMHVDGAYTVFRHLNPDFATFAAVPALGHQRSSRSDITPRGHLLDRFDATRGLINLARRLRDKARA